MTWKKVKLGDVLNRKRRNITIENDKEYKLTTIKLHHKGVVLRSLAKGENIKSNMSEIKAGDFILSGIDARNGAFGIVPTEMDEAIITNDFWCLDPDENQMDKQFFLFLTSTSFFDNICKQSSDGTTQRIRLQREKFFDYEITLPPITEQQGFVKKFQATQTKQIELLTQLTTQQTLIKKLKQAYLSEAIRGELVEQDLSDEPARELLARIKAEKLKNQTKKFKPLKPITAEEIPFQIPKSWTWCRLGEICEFISGNNFESGDFGKNNGIKCIKITNAGVQSIFETNDTLPLEFETKYKNYLAFTGDLILALTRPYIAEGLKISICPFSYNSSLINQRVAILRTNKLTWNKYIYTFLKSETVLNLYKSKFQKIGQQPNLKKDDVVNLLIPLPPLAEQGRIVARLDELMALCDRLESENLRSQAQTKELLAVVLKESLNATF